MTPTPTPEVVVTEAMEVAYYEAHAKSPFVLATPKEVFTAMIVASPQPVVAPSDLDRTCAENARVEDLGLSKTIPSGQTGDVAPQTEEIRTAYKTGYQEGVADSGGMFDRESCEEGWGQYFEAKVLKAHIYKPSRLPLPTVDDGRGGRRSINPQDDR